jgi:hypothetical protein
MKKSAHVQPLMSGGVIRTLTTFATIQVRPHRVNGWGHMP